ncbi:hypothetical protein QBC36DRAFT_125592 [Triangularia setosa]|uniref:Non-canonical purine NTP phosphatase/PRRC1 domain-containing protein n=1 Tax=Triangularia setosa TaxID=2587417 RepID=A0AAN6W9B9_9PEZI|nr:hypothetical protein QBC36DRAFT_125592 [Podospora setosa]
MVSESTPATASPYVKEHLPKKSRILPLKLFDPPKLPEKGDFLPPLSFKLKQDSTEKRLLVIIPSSNKSKVKLLEAHFEKNLPPNTLLSLVSLTSVSSGVGEQPYNEAGIDGAYNRIDHALIATPLEPAVRQVMLLGGITTVIYAAIESFIARPGYPPPAPGEKPSTEPVDYAYILFYNPVARVVKTGVSQGVSVPEAYYDEAQTYGFSDPLGQRIIAKSGKGKTSPEEAQQNHGKVTVGEIMAANMKGLDKANWHKFLTGGKVCRYQLIEDALEKMEMPW